MNDKRVRIEVLDRGWLVTVSQVRPDGVLGRYVFTTLDELVAFLIKELSEDVQGG